MVFKTECPLASEVFIVKISAIHSIVFERFALAVASATELGSLEVVIYKLSGND